MCNHDCEQGKYCTCYLNKPENPKVTLAYNICSVIIFALIGVMLAWRG